MGDAEMELTPAGAFEFLLGRWTLDREVSGQARMVGELWVSAVGEGTAVYAERATVRTEDGARFSGSQRYLVRRCADGVVLCFAGSGAVFQELRFAAGGHGSLWAEAVHRCAEDEYLSAYALGPGRAFMVRHEVSGPRKAYVSVTRFFSHAGLESGDRDLRLSCSGERNGDR